jgi:hypothetical protein
MVIMGKPAGKVEEALIREGWKTLVKKMGVAKLLVFWSRLSVEKETP